MDVSVEVSMGTQCRHGIPTEAPWTSHGRGSTIDAQAGSRFRKELDFVHRFRFVSTVSSSLGNAYE